MSIEYMEFAGWKILQETFDTTQKAPSPIVGRVPAPYVRPASCQRRTKGFPLGCEPETEMRQRRMPGRVQ